MTGCFSQCSLHGCPYTAIIDKIIRLMFNEPIVVTTSDNPGPMAVFYIPDSRFLAKCNTGKRETYPYSQPLFGKERRFQTIGQLILIRMTKCRDFYRRAGQLKTAFQRSFPNIQLLTRFTQFPLRKRLSFRLLQTDQRGCVKTDTSSFYIVSSFSRYSIFLCRNFPSCISNNCHFRSAMGSPSAV